MKVYVQGNCPNRAYVEYFTHCFPDWEVKAALVPQADEWVREGNEKFLSYIGEIDLFIGLTDRSLSRDFVNKDALNILVPSFDFFGFHPDCIHLQGIVSPLGMGVFHSSILAKAFHDGIDEQDAIHLFNLDNYRALGYLDAYQPERHRILKKFADAGIDLSGLFNSWEQTGCFLYTVNHPRTQIFFDIIHAALEPHFPGAVAETISTEARTKVTDYLGDGIVWPVYAEIAEHLGLQEFQTRWRNSVANGDGAYCDLPEFVHRSYQRFAEIEAWPKAALDKVRMIRNRAQAA